MRKSLIAIGIVVLLVAATPAAGANTVTYNHSSSELSGGSSYNLQTTDGGLVLNDETTVVASRRLDDNDEFTYDYNPGEDISVTLNADDAGVAVSVDTGDGYQTMEVYGGRTIDFETDQFDTLRIRNEDYYDFVDIEVSTKTTAGQYISEPYDVTNPSEGYVDLDLSNTTATILWQGYDGSKWVNATTDTVTQSGVQTTSLSGISTEYNDWRVRVDMDADSGASSWSGSLNEEGIRFENDAPTVSNLSPPDGTETDSSSVTLSADISDSEFGTVQGESVEARFVDADDGSTIGTDTLQSNGTASVTWSGSAFGQNEWYVVAEDSYGGSSQSQTLSLTTPSALSIYNESAPSQLVNDSMSVEVTFFEDDQTYTRTTSNGQISLAGLPYNSVMTVQISANGYITRQTIIRSTEQQRVYILPDSAETVTTRFEINDPTGQFSSGNTRILIQKPIEYNGTTEYQTVIGDTIGAGEFSTILERDQRYKIAVEDIESGDIRELGPYVATASENVVLEVDELEYEFKNEGIGYRWNATYLNETGPALDFAIDTDHGFETLSVTVTNTGTGEVVAQESWANGQTIQERIDIATTDSKSTTYSVEWSATVKDGSGGTEDVSGSVVIGPDGMEVGLDGVHDRVIELVAILVILLVAGLFSAANVAIGGVVTSITAGLFWFAGFLPGAVSGISIALALMLSVMWMVRNARGPT